jgi:peroxiredoxin 3
LVSMRSIPFSWLNSRFRIDAVQPLIRPPVEMPSHPVDSKAVLRLFRLDVRRSRVGVFFTRHAIDPERVRMLGNLDQERDAPTAARPRIQALRHLARSFGLRSPREVDQLPGGHVVAIADVVVQFHRADDTTKPDGIIKADRFAKAAGLMTLVSVNLASSTTRRYNEPVRRRFGRVGRSRQRGTFVLVAGHPYLKEFTTMPMVTSPAPKFDCKAVVNGAIKDLKWDELHEGKWLVLFFYPLDFTFVCPTEICAFSDAGDQFAEINAKVAAISVDSAFSHLAWVNTPRAKGGLGDVTFPIVADLTKDIAQAYDVLLKKAGIALRGLFIIDPKGVIRHATINDLPVGRNVDEVIRVIQAFQYVEEHGEVCPANWTPGKDSMKPDPKGSQEYFQKVNA